MIYILTDVRTCISDEPGTNRVLLSSFTSCDGISEGMDWDVIVSILFGKNYKAVVEDAGMVVTVTKGVVAFEDTVSMDREAVASVKNAVMMVVEDMVKPAEWVRSWDEP